jgi:hypothetical protein
MKKTLSIFCFVLCACCSWADDEPLKDATKYEGVARIYGAGHQWPNGYLDIPSGGNLLIVQKLSKVALEINEHSGRYDVRDVELKDVVKIINSHIPANSKWAVKVDKKVTQFRVSGVINKDLLRSLVSLMQNNNVYCRVTDGMVEFRDASKLLQPSKKDEQAGNKVSLHSPAWIKPERGANTEDDNSDNKNQTSPATKSERGE